MISFRNLKDQKSQMNSKPNSVTQEEKIRDSNVKQGREQLQRYGKGINYSSDVAPHPHAPIESIIRAMGRAEGD
jgi:hypothetical protein